MVVLNDRQRGIRVVVQPQGRGSRVTITAKGWNKEQRMRSAESLALYAQLLWDRLKHARSSR